MHRWSWWRPTRPPKSGFRIIIFDLLRNPLGKIRNIVKGIERFKYTNKPQTHSRIHSQSQKIRCRASVKCKPNKLYLSEYEYADAKPKEKGNPIYIFLYIYPSVCLLGFVCSANVTKVAVSKRILGNVYSGSNRRQSCPPSWSPSLLWNSGHLPPDKRHCIRAVFLCVAV